MKKSIIIFPILLISLSMHAQDQLKQFPFGSIQPSGWLKTQMKTDLQGFVGKLDILVPDLFNEPIYGKGRLGKHSKAKDLGNLKEGDAAGDEQYKWWNSETQSNWWDGYIRYVFMLDDKAGIDKVKKYIYSILDTQDEDGYIGIYDRELRYKFSTENGELWSKTTLYRGLIAYYEATGDAKILTALKKAVENVMLNYPVNQSSPFSSGNQFNGGVSHGLTFTDVLDKMFKITGDKKYLSYALFLYGDFSGTYQSEADVQLANITNPAYKLKSHGVHSFEHIRPLLLAASQKPQLMNALHTYLNRIEKATTITGGAIGDEWIGEREANETHTGYEYCSLQELLDSYCLAMQQTGEAEFGDKIETTFYNAAQGARNPAHSGIAYLKTDNSYEMLGTRNGEVEPDRKQTRYKYSPAHQDVAVCCSPNAGRISPYFVQNSWMREGEKTLVATLLVPCKLHFQLKNNRIEIENKTQYPFQNSFDFSFAAEKPVALKIKIRKPGWVTKVVTNEKYTIEKNFIIIERTFQKNDHIRLTFNTEVKIQSTPNNEKYISYGALIYAYPLQYKENKGRTYAAGLCDYYYQTTDSVRYKLTVNSKPELMNGSVKINLLNTRSDHDEDILLVPLSKTILRQVTF